MQQGTELRHGTSKFPQQIFAPDTSHKIWAKQGMFSCHICDSATFAFTDEGTKAQKAKSMSQGYRVTA